MQLVIIILNETEHLNELMELLVNLGVPGATVLDSEGMGKVMRGDSPLLARLGPILESVRDFNKTVITLVEDRLAEQVLDAVATRYPEAESGTGLAFSLPVTRSVRLRHL